MRAAASYVYRIDARDRLIYVSEDWLAFARENDAPELVPGSLMGAEIWSFIQGETIQDVYQAMFDRVRVSGIELVVPFRCDSPEAIRRMELAMRPVGRGEIELEGRLLSTGPRENVHLLDRHARRARRTVPICSFCRQVAVSGSWLEASEAVARYGFLSGATPPRLREQICTSCAERGV